MDELAMLTMAIMNNSAARYDALGIYVPIDSAPAYSVYIGVYNQLHPKSAIWRLYNKVLFLVFPSERRRLEALGRVMLKIAEQERDIMRREVAEEKLNGIVL